MTSRRQVARLTKCGRCRP